MGKVMMSGVAPNMTVPMKIAEGSIVKLNENGSPVEFYVAKNDYENTLNGTGRILLVRKDCYDIRVWHSSNVNAYAASDIDSWLDRYKGLLDDDIQSAIGTTKFYYTPGNGNKTITTLERSIFLLSVTELAKSVGYANKEGAALSIASILEVANRNGSAVHQWTRSPNTYGTASVCYVSSTGNAETTGCNNNLIASRPAFTLPSSISIRDDGMVVL